MAQISSNTEAKETDPLIDRSLSEFTATRSSRHLLPAEARELPPNHKNKRSTMLATLLILFTEMCERLTYYSIMAGLVLFCTSNLGIDQASATTLNQVFSGFVYMIPVFGGFLADAYIGRYRTIFISCIIYMGGVVLIPASAVDYSTWGWTDTNTSQRRALFITGLVLVGIGTGGIKANVGPFGAEQVESRGKEAVQSFFNWFYWVINLGALIAFTVVAYVQQEISFAWGFFIPTVSMLMALLAFVFGYSKYQKTAPKGSVLTTACGICGQGSCQTKPKPNPNLPLGSERKFLARSKKSFGGSYEDHLVDGVTSVVKVIPFCLLAVMFWAINAQMSNTFFAQAERMDVRLGGGINIPAAALNGFNTIGIIILIPVVDKVVYPFFERIGHPLTYLKRIGIGMVLAAVGVTLAGIVEIYRKKLLNEENGSHTQVLAGETFTASSMSVFVQIPQFLLIGTSEIFASVTVLEFAYNQAPVAMQGLLTGLFLASAGVGNWVATAILSIVEAATKDDPWWSSEINNAKMENLMFLLAGLMMLNTIVFIVVAHFYTYQDPSQFEPPESQANQHPGLEEHKNLPTGVIWTREDDQLHHAYDDIDQNSEDRNGYDGDTEGFAVMQENDKTPLSKSEY